ncbi:hypothetical protein OG800_01820 [Streptomyces sp. NBC_00445]|uniref:hypothetical protein n=1 Tax=unclassified Streptomyces TaxID=2593676 RepID=UPI002E24A097|nr:MULTISPECIES: hypothetical protein [unclassified Streptomyces]
MTQDEKFLYVQNAVSGTIDGFRIGRKGSLTTTATGLPAFADSGMEGIPAVQGKAATAAPTPRTPRPGRHARERRC